MKTQMFVKALCDSKVCIFVRW